MGISKKKKNDMVLFVADCSDTSDTLKAGSFFECFKMGHVMSDDGTKDYIVRCADDLREETFSAGLGSDQALVNECSMFLMTHDKFHALKNDEEKREQFLDSIEQVLSGEKVPEHYANWRNRTLGIMSEKNMFADDVMASIRKAFTPRKMKLISFPD